MSDLWDPAAPGVLALPSGRLVRGRGVAAGVPTGPVPAFGLYVLGQEPPPVSWDSQWVRWPDFGLPSDGAALRQALTRVLDLAATQRVEVACAGGRGRTGTALACLAVMDGVPARDAVAYVRQHYSPHAVETPWQRWYVRRWQPS